MVNIKTISRSEDDFKRARKRDVDKGGSRGGVEGSPTMKISGIGFINAYLFGVDVGIQEPESGDTPV
eukprot:1316840-Amorphochlora_amoeboformis.AAC.1